MVHFSGANEPRRHIRMWPSRPNQVLVEVLIPFKTARIVSRNAKEDEGDFTVPCRKTLRGEQGDHRLRVRNFSRRSGVGAISNARISLAVSARLMPVITSPTLAKADEALDKFVADHLQTDDANDILYALDASRDYDPGPSLEKIRAPLVAVNFADDLINPPELGILEREIKRVPKGRAVLIPSSDQTRGHGSHTLAFLWKGELNTLLQESED